MARKVLPGRSYPLGAVWERDGVNFALYSEQATKVELCLFDSLAPTGRVETIALPEVTGHVWHGCIPGIRRGQLYGYRVHGPFEPEAGQRFNSAKLLVDPYAKALAGTVDWNAPVFGYPLGHEERDLARDDRDDAWGIPKGVVIDSKFDWEGDERLRTPWHESIIYEAHVKGLTVRHPDVPKKLRGTYAGLAWPAVIDHFHQLGVTAVELLPVHAFLDDKILLDRGLRNYWGYNTINYFAPDARYSSSGDMGGQVREFKEMVKALHRAGIEVILDVVYNHTAEGNELGPTLSFRGIDNSAYYRLVPDQPRYYLDYTGTGNTPNTRHPQVLQLIMDSLRYWVLEMHVDGFRFDLAAALARGLFEVDHLSAFFDIIHQDPVLSTVKLIAEPWDVGEGGYQVGNFPVLWAEWNGKYRDCVRKFWKGDEGQVGELAYRLTGSSDLYESSGRRPYASVNFIVAHDGFTMNDLVSYNEKHNDANGEENRDGANDNNAWNCGVEGPTNDPKITILRERQKWNFMATLLLSQGVPMICGGDEIGRSQQGNNNAYCQDNEISWFDWRLDDHQRSMFAFTCQMSAIRHAHPVLRRRKFFQGRPIRGSEVKDITWLRPDGREMTEDDWQMMELWTIGMRLAGGVIGEVNERGEPVTDETLLILINAHSESVPFVLPPGDGAHVAGRWNVLVDTQMAPDIEETVEPEFRIIAEGDEYLLGERSLVVLQYSA